MIGQLFAQQSQGRAFLMMLLAGLMLAAVAQAGTILRRRWPWAGVAADVLLASLLLAALLLPLFLLDTPLRLYGLLGLALGGAVWWSGFAPVWNALIQFIRKITETRRKTDSAGRNTLY